MEVLRMHQRDQQVRREVAELLQAGDSVDTAVAQRVAARQDSVDRGQHGTTEGDHSRARLAEHGKGRQALGLPPLHDYLEQLKQAYGLSGADTGER